MSALEAVPAGAGAKHPLRIGMENRDARAVIATLSDDVVFWSPVATRPFVGIDEVAEVIEILIDKFEELEYPEEWVSGSTEIVTFRGRIGGWPLEGAEFLRHDEDGKVRELHIQTRPLTGSAAVAKAVGPALARRRGRSNAIVLWLVSTFGPRFLWSGETIADRFYRRPR